MYGAGGFVPKGVKRKLGGDNTVPLILSGPPCLSAAVEQVPSDMIVLYDGNQGLLVPC